MQEPRFHSLHFGPGSAAPAKLLAQGAKMQEYCAYIVGPDGHILNRIDIFCTNEDEAKDCAVRLMEGENVELWQRDRRIAEFKGRHEAAAQSSLVQPAPRP